MVSACQGTKAWCQGESLSRGQGECLVPPYTRGSFSLTRARARAWCLRIPAEVSLSHGPGREPGASLYTRWEVSYSHGDREPPPRTAHKVVPSELIFHKTASKLYAAPALIITSPPNDAVVLEKCPAAIMKLAEASLSQKAKGNRVTGPAGEQAAAGVRDVGDRHFVHGGVRAARNASPACRVAFNSSPFQTERERRFRV